MYAVTITLNCSCTSTSGLTEPSKRYVCKVAFSEIPMSIAVDRSGFVGPNRVDLDLRRCILALVLGEHHQGVSETHINDQ